MNTPLRARALRWIIRAAHLSDEQITEAIINSGHRSVKTGAVSAQLPKHHPTSIGPVACGTMTSRSISVSVTGSGSRGSGSSGASVHLYEFASAEIGMLPATEAGLDEDRFYLEFHKRSENLNQSVTVYLGTRPMLDALNHALAAFDLEQQASEEMSA